MTVGERIKKTREYCNISQVDLAKRIGVSKQSLYKYETNVVTNIPSNVIEQIANILDVSPCYLMGWEEKEYSKKEPHKIMQYYELLNDIGKHEATKRVEELTHLQKYTKEGDNKNNTVEFSEELTPDKDYLLPNAAHADESLTEITEEMIQAEDDIMDNL